MYHRDDAAGAKKVIEINWYVSRVLSIDSSYNAHLMKGANGQKPGENRILHARVEMMQIRASPATWLESSVTFENLGHRNSMPGVRYNASWISSNTQLSFSVTRTISG